MCKKLFLCSALFLLFFHVQAQAYLITEVELQALETEFQACKASRQKALQKLKVLSEELTRLKKSSTDLSMTLQKERETTSKLTQFLNELEGELSKESQRAQRLQSSYDAEKLKRERAQAWVIILAITLVFFVILTVGYGLVKVYLKGRKILPFLP